MAPPRKLDYPISEYEKAIKRLGWSQVEAAKILGIDPTTSRRYIRGDPPQRSTTVLLRILVSLKDYREAHEDMSEDNPEELHAEWFEHASNTVVE